jgi:hypothetical protein
MKKLKKIPKFKSIAEEARFWATHDSTEYIDYAKAFSVKPRRKKATISLPSLDEFRSTIKVSGKPLSKTVIAARKRERN